MSWKNVALGEVCIVKRGTTITLKEAIDGEIPVVAGGLKPTYYHNLANRLGNTITISGSGANAGFVNFWNQPIFASDCSTVEIINNKLDITYVYYFLLSKQQYIYNELRSGAAQPHVYGKDIAKIVISVPPIAIQHKIVAKLDAIFAEIDIATAAAETNANNAEALFQSYLSKIIQKNSENSKVVKLGMICEIARGGSPRPIDKFITDDKDGINWIKIGDATRSKKYIFETREKIIKDGVSRSRLVQDGDFLLSNSMSYGRPYIMRTTGCIHDGWLVLSKYQEFLDIDYFYFLLSSAIVVKQFDNLAQGSTVSNLNKELVSRVEVRLPSLSNQKLIVSKLNLLTDNIDIVKNSYNNKIRELLKFKQSILQKAFSGELVKD